MSMSPKEKIGNIISIANSISERSFVIGMFSMLFMVALAYCFHGLDLTDRGWVLSGYQQIFAHPESVESMFYMYDTLLIGGVWEKLFGQLGYIGFNILSVLFLLSSFAIMYTLLRKYLNRWILFLGFMYLTIGQISVFSYNIASLFFAMLSIYFIYQALMKTSMTCMYIAGIVLGMSLFVRFPNLALTGFILVLIVYYGETKNITETLKLFIIAIGGYITGIVANVMLLFTLNHAEPMLSMLDITSSMLSSSDSTHSMPGMLTLYMSLYWKMLKYMYPIVFFPCIMYIIDRWEISNKVKNALLILCGGAFCLFLVNFFSKGSIAMHGFCCLAYMLVFLKRNTYDKYMLYLASLSFLMMWLMPMGSDGGIGSVRESVLFALVFTLGIFWNEIQNVDAKWGQAIRIVMMCTMCIVLINSVRKSLSNSYRDPGSKFQKTAMVKQSYRRTTFTNPDKAEALDELLSHVKPLLIGQTELIAYPSIPGIHYLANTTSYINVPWIGIVNDAVFDMEFEKAKQKDMLPVILINKAPHGCWYEPLPQWKSVSDCIDWQDITHKNEVLNDFIKRHEYAIVFDNAIFQVLNPIEK